MVRRRGRLRPRAKAPGRPPCFPAAMYSRRMPRIVTCRPADAVRLLADGFGRGRLERASLEARKRCRAWPARIPEAALFRVTLSGGPARACNCRHGVWCLLLTARFLPANRPAVIDRPANRPGGTAWGAAACACACRAASGRRGMQRSVRLPGRHDPLACRRRIRRRERCLLSEARYGAAFGRHGFRLAIAGRQGGVPAAGLLPGGHGAANRRHCTAALLGGSKWGSGAPPEWCRLDMVPPIGGTVPSGTVPSGTVPSGTVRRGARDAKVSFQAARRSPDGCGRADRPCLSRGNCLPHIIRQTINVSSIGRRLDTKLHEQMKICVNSMLCLMARPQIHLPNVKTCLTVVNTYGKSG